VPVYLFTFHAYRSWMPDHKRGYTKRNEGYQPTDEETAQNYARRAKHEETVFDEAIERALIQEMIDSCAKIRCRLHAGTTEPTHIHGLVSWKYVRGWMSIRKSLKSSLTKRLKEISQDIALSRGASRKHVLNRGHFEYLMDTYLPGHHGLAWYEDRGWVLQDGTKRKRRRNR
jgi:REP element-mobilizing transposase RayT